MAVEVFQHDDQAYLDWRERHAATGYVLTLPRQRGERPSMLHAARCWRTIPPVSGRYGVRSNGTCRVGATLLRPRWSAWLRAALAEASPRRDQPPWLQGHSRAARCH